MKHQEPNYMGAFPRGGTKIEGSFGEKIQI
jgi:hypothetical protein